jgi:2-oxoisovalerate dehydrogenase E1 component
LWKEFGGGRVIDTPISELAFTGAALGASATGSRAVADLMFIEFLFEAASQVILQASKLRYMSNNQMSAPVVMRAASGAVRGAGPHHSGSYHPLWAHVPGLIVVMPSNPADAKGLMKTALRAYDPVIFLEPKILFGSKGEVPTGEHLVPFGQAKIVREGKNLTIVAFGQMVQVAVAAAAALEKEGISCEVLDPRTVVPLDVEAIAASLAKTGHLLIVDEGYSMCGIGAEIAQSMMELAFDDLDAPIGRLHTDPVSHPVSDIMEEAVAVTLDKVIAGAKQVMAGHSPRAIRAKGLSAVAGPGAESADTPAGKAPADAGRKASAEAASPSAPTVTSPSAPTVTSTPAPAALAAPAPPTPVKGEALTMPHGDLTVTEATVVKWYKKVGDPVAKGETVVDVETDKAVTYIESPIDGVLVQILEPEGKVVKMGQQLAVIGPK